MRMGAQLTQDTRICMCMAAQLAQDTRVCMCMAVQLTQDTRLHVLGSTAGGDGTWVFLPGDWGRMVTARPWKAEVL